jgi:hypothetical protein
MGSDSVSQARAVRFSRGLPENLPANLSLRRLMLSSMIALQYSVQNITYF